MSIYINLSAIAALIAGILILIIPRLLNYIVAIYLIVIDIVGLIHRELLIYRIFCRTISSGTKLDVRSAPAGGAPGMACIKDASMSMFKVISGALVLMIFGMLQANAADQSICISGSNVVLYPNGSLQSCVLNDSFRSNGTECKQQSPISFYDNGLLETCVLAESATIDRQKCKPLRPIRFYPSGEFQSCVKEE